MKKAFQWAIARTGATFLHQGRGHATLQKRSFWSGASETDDGPRPEFQPIGRRALGTFDLILNLRKYCKRSVESQ